MSTSIKGLATIAAAFGLGVALAGSPAPAAAQSYPSRPVKIVVPYPPGGGTDVMARTLATQLGNKAGQPFIIENKPGADAVLGAEIAARAAPDGYTLLAVSGVPFVLNQVVFSKLPYNVLDDFEPVALFAQGPLVLIVHPSFPADNVRDWAAQLKSNPGKYNYAGSDQYTYLTTEMILQALGTKATHVPYKGVGPSLTDVLGGHVPMMLSSLAPALPLIQQKKVKALAVATKARSPALPDVPTIAETIVPGFDVPAWYAILAPKGTPKPIVAFVNDVVNKAADTPEVKTHLTTLGTDVVHTTPEEFAAFLRPELEKWRKVARDTNLPTQ